MRALYLGVVLLFTLGSCTSAIKNENKEGTDEVPLNEEVTKTVVPLKAPGNANFIINKEEDLVGFWIGMFEPLNNGEDRDGVSAGEYYWDYSNKINISIDKIENGKVTGHSVVAGNNRPFSGKVKLENGVYVFNVNEPGDDKYDGAFEFKVKKADTALQGSWFAFKEVKIPARTYTLQKRLFQYDPRLQPDYGRYVDWTQKVKSENVHEDEADNDYDASFFTTTEDIDKYNASVSKLTVKQVSNMKKGDLFILRNTIYARHGYSFKKQQLRAYFDLQSWYIPVTTDVKDYLTEIEKENIALLLRYEKNAKEYYDVFGRG